jgi:hypothetical protein
MHRNKKVRSIGALEPQTIILNKCAGATHTGKNPASFDSEIFWHPEACEVFPVFCFWDSRRTSVLLATLDTRSEHPRYPKISFDWISLVEYPQCVSQPEYLRCGPMPPRLAQPRNWELGRRQAGKRPTRHDQFRPGTRQTQSGARSKLENECAKPKSRNALRNKGAVRANTS